MSERQIPERGASIAGPLAKTAWLNGRDPEGIKRCHVWVETAALEILGEAPIAAPAMVMSKEVLVAAGNGASFAAPEILAEIGGQRYRVQEVADEALDGAPVRRLKLAAILRASFLSSVGLMKQAEPGDEVTFLRQDEEEATYYGTFLCISKQADAYRQRRSKLERQWRAANNFPTLTLDGNGINELPLEVKEDLEVRAAAGTYVVGFERFVGEDGAPIPAVLPDGSLNEPALLKLLAEPAFRGALQAFYASENFDYEEHLAQKKRRLNSSNGT